MGRCASGEEALKATYCFTSDTDWAPEPAIENLLNLFEEWEVPLTPFITHPSPAIEEHYRDRPFNVGLHPNFLANSTHGKSESEVIDRVIKLWPEARCFRCHAYFGHAQMMREFLRRGFVYDSNICLQMQRDIQPLVHWTGIVRFPTFYEDDMPANGLIERAHTSGLKIFNFHPRRVWEQKEIRTLLYDLLREFGEEAVYLDELYEDWKAGN